ncbi:hypothetical protein V8F20_004730 [Naviculisporaceae sp. PSN 640]
MANSKTKEDKDEVSLYNTWIKSHIPTTAIIGAQAVGLTEPPIFSPICVEEESQLVLRIDDRALQRAVEGYLMNNPGCEFWQKFDPKTCSWGDVLDELETAKMRFDDKGKRSFTRRVLRNHVDGISRNLEPILGILPQEYGGGLLQAAFKIIFQAVKRRTETCARIFTAFEEIPITLITAEGYRNTYINYRDFSECYSHLHYHLAVCLPSLIDILLRRGKESRFKVQCRGMFVDTTAEVEAILKPLKEAERRLLLCQKHLEAKVGLEARQYARSSNEKLDAFGTSVRNLEFSVNNLSPTLKAMIDNVFREVNRQGQVHSSYSTRIERFEGTLRQLKDLVLDLVHRDKERASNLAMRLESPRSERRANLRLTLSQAPMICTNQERDSYVQDIYTVRRAHHNFGEAALARAYYLMISPRFLEWLSEPDSDIILVDGHCDDQCRGRISPLSSFCAGLAETLSKGDTASENIAKFLPDGAPIVLSFFCGEHSMLGDDNGLIGPHGLIRCLIDQLLGLWPHREPPDISANLQSIEPWNPATFQNADILFLCQVFDHLLRQLGPRHTVYCIIDGVSYFETDAWRWGQGLSDVVDCLSEFVCSQRTERAYDGDGELAPLKVILASPERSTEICWKFPENSQISLRAGNTGAFSAWLGTR